MGAHFCIRGHLGGPCDQQDGFEKVNNRILVDLGVIRELVYVRGFKMFTESCLVWACFQVIFNRILTRNFDVWDFHTWFSLAWDVLQKSAFRGNRFNEFRDRFSLFLGSLGSGFSGFLGVENKVEHTTIFSDMTESESGIWWGRSTRYLVWAF